MYMKKFFYSTRWDKNYPSGQKFYKRATYKLVFQISDIYL